MKYRVSTSRKRNRAKPVVASTPRAESEAARLSIQDNLYKAVFDSVVSEVHIWELVRDADHRIVTWRLIDANQLALKNWGKKLEEVKGKTTDDIFPGANASRLFMPIIEKIFTENKAYSWENYFPGTDQTLQMTTIPLGNLFISTGIDVSHIRRSERDLIRSQQRLELATEAAHVGIWEYELRNKKLVWDHSMYKIYGVPEDDQELTYSSWAHRVHPDDYEVAASTLEQAIAQEASFKHEYRIVCLDTQKIKHILADAVFKKGPDGESDRMIGVNIDITDLKQAEEKIERLAYFAPLTGLPNRFTINDRLSQSIAFCGRTATRGALIFIDLDDFKRINDSAGHMVGDELLIHFAHRLQAEVRKADTIGRFGGDEFIIILNNLHEECGVAQVLAEKFAFKMQQLTQSPFQLSSGSHLISASFGITLFDGESTIDDVLRQADIAMYKAKGTGRNRVYFFDPVMQQEFQERIDLEDALEGAILHEDIETYYQLQVRDDGRLRGAEVLARWRHPSKGYVSPTLFIHIAEDIGLIDKLGSLILKKAFTDFKQFIEPHVPDDFVISINVSAAQILMSDFVESVFDTVERTGILPEKVKFEITETILLTSSDIVSERLFALKNRGFKFSLDDFGTGYSSLIMLKSLPIDELKIDQSFVKDISSNPSSAAISKSIIALARSMDIAVIAEGVEEDIDREKLMALGCDAFQGYLFSKPLPLNDFLARVDSLRQAEGGRG